jgi:hypothetical protein
VKIYEAEYDLFYGLGGRETVRCLPEDIRMPHMLEIGQTVYEVKMNYMAEGIRINPMRVTGIRVYEGWSNDKYDYSVHYDAKGPKGSGGAHDFSFQYPHDDAQEPELKANYGGHLRYFLTEEAADRTALEMIGRLRENFNTLAKDIRERAHERRLEASAPHYGLDL